MDLPSQDSVHMGDIETAGEKEEFFLRNAGDALKDETTVCKLKGRQNQR